MQRYNSDDSFHSSQSQSPPSKKFYAPPTRPLTNFDPRNNSNPQQVPRQEGAPILKINPNLIPPTAAFFSPNTSPNSYYAPDTPRAMEFGDAASIRNGRDPSISSRSGGTKKGHGRSDTQAVFNRFSIMVKKEAGTLEKDHQSEWLKSSNNAGSRWVWGGWLAGLVIVCSVAGVLLWFFLYFRPHQHHATPKTVVTSIANSTIVSKVTKRAVDFGLNTLKQ